jgi:hypothetical protein
MVSRLFEKEKEVFSWNVFEKKQKKSRGLKSMVEGNDVWVKMQGLMDMNLMMIDEKDVCKRRDGDKIPLTFERPARLDPSRLWRDI